MIKNDNKKFREKVNIYIAVSKVQLNKPLEFKQVVKSSFVI